jgi:DnaK suppressor protein
MSPIKTGSSRATSAKSAPKKAAVQKPVSTKAPATKAQPVKTASVKAPVSKDASVPVPEATPRAASPKAPYRPTESEPYMGKRQLAYFREKLAAWKEEILLGNRETINGMQENVAPIPDLVDRAASEADRALELRTRDRQRKLINKIDSALRRIEIGEYGYCEETGEPIGVKRLEARPTATLCLEAQERHERKERTVRDD